MIETQEYTVTSTEGPNGVGKGAVLSNVRYLLETICLARYAQKDISPFRTAVVTEPPQLPLTYYAHKPEAYDSMGHMKTWRSMLKEGMTPDILRNATNYPESRNATFAEGFLTARAVIEAYLKNDFDWSFGNTPAPFIDMLPNIVAQCWGRYEWSKLPFTRMVIKDRGTGSTAVFQGEDPVVRNMIIEMYESGELAREALTLVFLPTDSKRWIDTLALRAGDVDIHDGKYSSQLEKYRELKNRWGNIFSDNIVYVENDPSGVDIRLNELSFLVSLLYLAIKQNGFINWYDQSKRLNYLNVDIFTVMSLLERSPLREKFHDLRQIVGQRGVVNYVYKDVPLVYYSGNIGLVSNHSSPTFNTIDLLVANDLKDYVQQVRK